MVVSFPTGRDTVPAADPDAALSQCRRLARVLTITREMLELADAGDWDAVAERERSRREDLQLSFLEPTDTENTELVAEALAAVLHLNEELMAKLAEARENVLRQGVEQVRTSGAIRSYQDVTGA